MSAVVRIIEQPAPVVILREAAGAVIKLAASPPPATVRVMAQGTQGPRGEQGSGGAAPIEFSAAHGGAFDVTIAANGARLWVNGLMAAQSEFSVAAGSLHIPSELGVMTGDIITIQPI